MKKSDLKTGMRVQLRGSLETYIVLIDFRYHVEDVGHLVNLNSFIHLSDYDEDLYGCSNPHYDIVKCFNIPKALVSVINPFEKGELLWERDPEKTYTIDDVEYSESSLRSLIKKATQ
jgi:hypothetical protein